MPYADAVDIFLLAASVCVVILTVLFGAVAVVLMLALQEVRSLIGRIGGEVARFQKLRARTLYRGRFASRATALFVRRLRDRFFG